MRHELPPRSREAEWLTLVLFFCVRPARLVAGVTGLVAPLQAQDAPQTVKCAHGGSPIPGPFGTFNSVWNLKV